MDLIMSTMTLKQLKEENAPEDDVNAELTPEAEETETEVAAEESTEELEGAGESTEGEAEEEAVEAWMQTEGETSESTQHKGPSFKGLKQKWRAKVEVKDEKIAELEAKINALSNGNAQTQEATQPNAQLPPRPKREDFDFNDDAYDNAVDAWNDARQDARQDSRVQQQTQQQEMQSSQNDINRAVDKHYENAEKLVAEGKVTEDEYRNADQVVRGIIEQVMPQRGEVVSDFLISRLNGSGEGSEKVWYHLGRNEAALNSLRAKLANDPQGIDAAMYLGELRAKLTSEPAKRVSQAPRPGTKLKGDAKTGVDGALLKKYKAAANDVQSRINLKREAKSQGIDTSNWS